MFHKRRLNTFLEVASAVAEPELEPATLWWWVELDARLCNAEGGRLQHGEVTVPGSEGLWDCLAGMWRSDT